MKSMVLINCDTGLKHKIVKTLKGMNIKIFQCFGAYDFIVEVNGDSDEEVRRIIWEDIRRIEGIRSTSSLVISSSWSDPDG